MNNSPEGPEIIATVKKAVEGDMQAYGRLYSLYVDRIFRYILYQVGDRMTAEDITEEVFLKSWKSITSCKGREQTFSAWLYRIAHNHLVDTFRKNRRNVSLETIELADEKNTESEVEDRLDLQKVLEEVKKLPEPQQQVILLKYLDDVDNEEIGRIMGKRQGAVRALQMRALMNLREKFNPGMESNG